ncbi:MAG TPA: sensor domain-containing diguanylate cyclase [Candidatus Hydrogenedentes bacterium]|nr:sensor domain-containing diguanylate cyclase [Candidatus Hydrogenedentota bacterium]
MSTKPTTRHEQDYEVLYKQCLALRQQVEHLAVLREISLAVNASLELNETLPIVANVVQSALEVRRLTLYELEKDGVRARPIVAKYGGDLIERSRLEEEYVHVAGTPFEGAVRTRQVALVETAYERRAYVPLIAKNDVFGIMLLEDPLSGIPFTKQDAALFQQIGLQIAVAINNAHLYALAVNDGLTGLYVRRYFDLRMDEEFEKARRYARAFSVLLFDIDHFKRFNDTHGHQTGDLVLKEFARLLRANTRKSDICCRYGGEEMAIILPETEIEEASVLANKLRRVIADHAFAGDQGQALRVTTSIGVAQYDAHFETQADMVRRADEALYEAKELGRNRVKVGKT